MGGVCQRRTAESRLHALKRKQIHRRSDQKTRISRAADLDGFPLVDEGFNPMF
jgi:hypothetical protein